MPLLPDHLSVEKIIIEPEEDTTDMVRIGEEVEITEELDYTPARFYTKRYIRPKYAPKNKVIDRTKKDKCYLGYYWVYHDPVGKTVLFHYQPRYSIKSADRALKNFKGYLQTDGYAVYESFDSKEEVTHLFCWAYARREFDRAKDHDEKRANIALTFIQNLYKIEEKARKEELTPDSVKNYAWTNPCRFLKVLENGWKQSCSPENCFLKAPSEKR